MSSPGASSRALAGALLALVLFCAPPARAEVSPIRLKAACPPGFELRDGTRCLLRNLYEFYDSLQGAGFPAQAL